MRKFIVIIVLSLFMGGSTSRPAKKKVVIIRSQDIAGNEILMQVK